MIRMPICLDLPRPGVGPVTSSLLLHCDASVCGGRVAAPLMLMVAPLVHRTVPAESVSPVISRSTTGVVQQRIVYRVS